MMFPLILSLGSLLQSPLTPFHPHRRLARLAFLKSSPPPPLRALSPFPPSFSRDFNYSPRGRHCFCYCRALSQWDLSPVSSCFPSCPSLCQSVPGPWCLSSFLNFHPKRFIGGSFAPPSPTFREVMFVPGLVPSPCCVLLSERASPPVPVLKFFSRCQTVPRRVPVLLSRLRRLAIFPPTFAFAQDGLYFFLGIILANPAVPIFFFLPLSIPPHENFIRRFITWCFKKKNSPSPTHFFSFSFSAKPDTFGMLNVHTVCSPSPIPLSA